MSSIRLVSGEDYAHSRSIYLSRRLLRGQSSVFSAGTKSLLKQAGGCTAQLTDPQNGVKLPLAFILYALFWNASVVCQTVGREACTTFAMQLSKRKDMAIILILGTTAQRCRGLYHALTFLWYAINELMASGLSLLHVSKPLALCTLSKKLPPTPLAFHT